MFWDRRLTAGAIYGAYEKHVAASGKTTDHAGARKILYVAGHIFLKHQYLLFVAVPSAAFAGAAVDRFAETIGVSDHARYL